MTEYNLDPTHRAVGEAYSSAKNIQNEELKESVESGLVNIARQARAAEEIDETGLFELADAMEYGAEGMGDIYTAKGAAQKQAQDYREAFAEIMSCGGNAELGAGRGNPIQMADILEAQAEHSRKVAETGQKPVYGPEELEEGIEKLEELRNHLEYGEQSQRDAITVDNVAEDAVKAYTGAMGVLVREEDALKRRYVSRLEEGDEDITLASTAVQMDIPENSL